MTSGDLISLLGYYIGILAIALAFFASQIETWKNRVLDLESEWSTAEQDADSQFKLKQQGEKTSLSTGKPLFALIAPIVLGASLVVLGYFALRNANAEVPRTHFAVFLLAPSIVLLLLYISYGVGALKAGSRKLRSLG